MRLGRLSETLTKRAQLDDFGRLQLGVTAGKVLQRVVEPLFLIVGMTPDDTALHDLLEELVTGFLIR